MLRGAAAAGLMMHTEKVTGMAQILPLAPRARPVIFSGEERKAREKMPWLPIYQFNLHQALMGTLNSFQPFLCATAPCSGCTCPAPEGTGITGVHGHAQTQLQLLLHTKRLSGNLYKGSQGRGPCTCTPKPQTRRFPNQGLLSDRDRKVL